MAEVRIIDGGTYNTEPLGPGWHGASPDRVPPADPEIPFENYRIFLVPFKDGDISPLFVNQDDAGGGTTPTVLTPAPDGTNIKVVLPLPGDGTKWTAVGQYIVDLSRDSAKLCAKLRTISPSPGPTLSALIAMGLLSQEQLLGFFYDSNVGQFFFFIQEGPTSAAAPLAPYAPGSEYEFEITIRQLSAGGQCLYVTAKQDGVLTASFVMPSPFVLRFPMGPVFHLETGTTAPGASFEFVAGELSVGYQPLAGKIGSCP